MKIVRADVLGYCFGVRKAVESAEEALKSLHQSGQSDSCSNEEKSSGKKVFTLGPLIHNAEVLSTLEKKGLQVLSPEDISAARENDVVVIRAHGTTPETIKSLENKNVHIVNATCPKVQASQKIARKWSELGCTVIIAGDRNHGEVTGIAGFAAGKIIVVQSAQEAEKLIVPEKAVLLAQTTFSPEEYKKITDIILSKNSSVKVYNTICSATLERQNALQNLKGRADGILVIGGVNSANTKRLYETAKKIAPVAALIENPSQIPDAFFAMQTVALTAGASTPDWIIDQTEQALASGSRP